MTTIIDTIDDYDANHDYHAVDLVSVASSNVAAVGWDAATRRLFVRFLDKNSDRAGALYAYENVPIGVYHGLINASSVGSYLNEHVKKAGYEYRRVE